jgi:hypothetical protein
LALDPTIRPHLDDIIVVVVGLWGLARLCGCLCGSAAHAHNPGTSFGLHSCFCFGVGHALSLLGGSHGRIQNDELR